MPADTIDPSVTEPENKNLLAMTSLFTPTKYWNGIFTSPAVYPDQFTSRYGTRRTYKGIGTDLTIPGFHTGLDFAGGEGLQIFAPAPGKVIFAAPLTVRGNATIIDHGLGVYSGFWHQSEILVNVGDLVGQGQVIGLVGGTGRVTGAHLHWELSVNGVQVNPLDWLNHSTADQPARVTPAFGCARAHRAGALVVKAGAPVLGANAPLNYAAAAADVCLLFDTRTFSGTHLVEVADPGPSPPESHRLRLFDTTADTGGYYRLPSLSRAGKLEVLAQNAPMPDVPTDWNPDYSSLENQLDITFP